MEYSIKPKTISANFDKTNNDRLNLHQGPHIYYLSVIYIVI